MLYVRGSVPSTYESFVVRAHDERAAAVSSMLGGLLAAPAIVVARTANAGLHSGRRFLGAVARWRRRRQAIRQLEAMNDALLKDIGIDRGHIPYVVDGQLAADRQRADRPTSTVGLTAPWGSETLAWTPRRR